MSMANTENTEPIKKTPPENKVRQDLEDTPDIPVDPHAETQVVKRAARKPRMKANPVSDETILIEKPEVPDTIQPDEMVKSTNTSSEIDKTTVIDTTPSGIFKEAGISSEIPPAAAPGQPGDEEIAPKVRRGKWIWLGVLIMLVLILAGAGIGYASGMRARQIEQDNQRLLLATTQFELGQADQREGRFEIAKKRYEYVLSIYPDFPGLDEKLVEVGLAIAQNQGGSLVTTPVAGTTPTVIITPIPTKDTRSVTALFTQAQSQLAAKDWDGLFTTLSSIRDINPEYKAVQADGMWYLALRNRGIKQVQNGQLEPGMYSFALAEQIAPIDADAESYRTWARLYLNAGSQWGVNWYSAVEGFAYLYPLVPQLRDSSGISVTQRYAGALSGYGDFLQQNFDYCGSVSSYAQANSIVSNTVPQEKFTQAQEFCANPPATPTPTLDPNAPTPTPTEQP